MWRRRLHLFRERVPGRIKDDDYDELTVGRVQSMETISYLPLPLAKNLSVTAVAAVDEDLVRQNPAIPVLAGARYDLPRGVQRPVEVKRKRKSAAGDDREQRAKSLPA